MNCEELKTALYQTRKNARLFTAKSFSKTKEALDKSLKTIPMNHNVVELRDEIMNLGTSRVVPSHHHEIPGKTEAEVAVINRQIDQNIEAIYEAASEYKFCFLEAFTKDETYETDPNLMGFYRVGTSIGNNHEKNNISPTK